MKKAIAVVLAIAVCIISVLPVGAASQNKETVKLCTFRSLGEFSPYTVSDDVEYEAVRYVFDCLYYIDENDRAKEMMGHSLSISEDNTEYRMTLRDDLKWHDGSSVTVEDVIFTFENAKNIDWYKHCVRALDSVSTEGNTVIFKLKYANPVFMKEAVTYVPIVPKAYYEKGEYNSIGCGAYKMTEKSHNEKYVLESTNYYLTSTNTNMIQIDVLPSEEDCVNGVIKAEYAMVFGDLGYDSFSLFNKDLQEVIDIYGMNSQVLFMNNETVFNDATLRKAVSLVIDYDKIVNEIYKEKAEKGSPGFFSSRLGYANKDISYYTNADEARLLLTNAGYTFNGGVLNDSLGNIVSSNILAVAGEGEQLAGVVKDAMESIGINANITVADKDTLMTNVKVGEYQSAIVHLDSYYQYCESNLNLLLGDGAANYSRYKSQNVSDALTKYTQTMDAYDRHSYLMEVQRIMSEEVPFITLCHSNKLNGYEKGVYSTVAYKEGVGIYSVLSFIKNRKSVDADGNADVLNGPEKGNAFIGAGLLIGVIVLGFGVYYVMNKRKGQVEK